jgi:putative alpha-1,2-mannosidase
LKDATNYTMLMKRSRNYINVFDPSTELMRGRLANGDWVKNFNPQFTSIILLANRKKPKLY